jgi:hypothetical protein
MKVFILRDLFIRKFYERFATTVMRRETEWFIVLNAALKIQTTPKLVPNAVPHYIR